MTTTSDFPASLFEAELQEQVPKPTTVRTLLLKNRRDRLLLQQLLRFAERIHVTCDSPAVPQTKGN